MESHTRSLKRKTPETEQKNERAEEREKEEQEHGKKLKTIHSSKDPPSKPVIELEKSKAILTIKQKPIELSEVSNQIKKSLVAVTEELEAASSSIHELSPSQNNLIACLVHESDRTLSELTNYVHSKLLPQSKLLIDQDQDSQKPFDPLPLSVIEDSIKQVAKRINYAPVHEDLDWLPSSLPKGFQIWRWECNDQDAVIPSDLKDITRKRWAERQLIKPQALEILTGLDSSAREALLKKLNPVKRKAKNNTDHPTTTPSRSTKESKSETPTLSQEIKSSVQNSPNTPKNTPSQGAESKETGEKVLTEKELIKQQREQKRKEKEDAKLAAERQKQKMGSLLSGWITKVNSTHQSNQASTSSNQSTKTAKPADGIEITAWFKNGVKQTVNKASMSDFERTFRPFHVKPNAQLAPINRFRLPGESNLEDKECPPGKDPTPKECLEQFLKSVHSTTPKKSKQKIMTIREIVNGIAESELTGCVEDTKKWRRALENRSVIPVKFLKFHEDVRPGYIGTWCKTSRLVSGRNPFGRDTCLLDYEYDSEADWNEEDAEGEDLEQNSDGGNEEGGDGMSSELGDSDEDGWLVGDDEDIEMIDDGENEASNRMLDVQIDDHQLAKQNKKISGPTRRKIVGPLIPVVKGPIWEDTLGLVSASMFECFRIQMINDAPIGLNPFTYEPKTITKVDHRPKLSTVGFKSTPAVLPLPANPLEVGLGDGHKNGTDAKTTNTHASNGHHSLGIENQADPAHSHPPTHQHLNSTTGTFPLELIPPMIKLVNGNRKAKPILLEELKNEFLINHRLKVSKRSIEQTLNSIAVKVAGTWRIVDLNSSPVTPSA
ncbi:hypothetical protein PCANC_00880 [Puccinia coronata f. sp. avenae]|uniref:Chromatin assembly factor 1 subunit A dimerization domain-containing protein n=1 Tax=Puccinia coronata f. sp. avenae TaxID=200324 RepID=A0A2N5VDV1_9BASI|nr:hypothetical protein PCANC_14657 [Puccinia coronata f. sp. avenae]PLW48096.1 hypothetical protein PCASD_03588 [Puccinia coronata f. sp. avenae]PLW58180.1 hypothetical protein PCANC_00880 [Puccinia coronata f. sp. avenae]